MGNKGRARAHLAGLWGMLFCLLFLSAPMQGARADAPPQEVPKGSILAFLPDQGSSDYSDSDSLERWLMEQGWAICDGTDGTPDLNYRMLLGTVHPDQAGQNLGARNHTHRARGDSAIAHGREHAIRSGVGRLIRSPAEGHKHKLDVATGATEHLPLSMRVIFIMKVR